METMPPHIFQKRNAKTAACTPRFLQQEKRRKEKNEKEEGRNQYYENCQLGRSCLLWHYYIDKILTNKVCKY